MEASRWTTKALTTWCTSNSLETVCPGPRSRPSTIVDADVARDPPRLRIRFDSNQYEVSFYRRQIETSGVFTSHCYFAACERSCVCCGSAELRLDSELQSSCFKKTSVLSNRRFKPWCAKCGCSPLGSAYEDYVDRAVVALAKMHAPVERLQDCV